MTKRILLGKFPDGDSSPNGYGLRISKEKYDVTTPNPDNEQLIFNSDWQGILPIYRSGILNQGESYAHGLGFIPFVSAMITLDNGTSWEQHVCLNYGAREINTVDQSYWGYSQTNQRVEWMTRTNSYKQRPQGKYAYDGDSRTNQCKVRVNTTTLYFDSSVASEIFYMIYNWKAF